MVCTALVNKVGGDDRRISITAGGVLSCTLMGENPSIAAREAFAEIDRVAGQIVQVPPAVTAIEATNHTLHQGGRGNKKGGKSKKK
jgi:hypothetical protein